MVRLPITNSWCIHRAVLISLVQPFLKLLPPPRGPSHSSGRVWRRKLAAFKRETATFPHSQLSLPASLWWLSFPLCLWFHFGRLYIISEFVQGLSFCSCLTSVSTMSSRSTCVVTSDVILPHTRLNSVLLHLYYFFLSFLLFYFWDCVLLCCPSCAEPNRWKLPFHFCLLSGWDSRYVLPCSAYSTFSSSTHPPMDGDLCVSLLCDPVGLGPFVLFLSMIKR